MLDFIQQIKAKAKKDPKRLVFPEGVEPRVLKAVSIILKEKTAHPLLIGRSLEIHKVIKENRLKINLDQVPIYDPYDSKHLEKYVKAYLTIRKEQNISEKEAWETVSKINYLGTLMVHGGEADGMISGSTMPTSDTIRPALQIIKTKKMFHKVSGFFFMLLKKRLLLFADCAVTINPDAHALTEIAEDTARTAQKFGIKPKIAFLSFSTNRSANHPFVDKVREAVALFKYKNKEIAAEGEMQVDAALVPEICERKFPHSKIKGDANVLIFPDLQAANIAYKLVERLGGAIAIGPVLQGLKKPVNDLSRGCTAEDIVNMAAITTLQAQEAD